MQSPNLIDVIRNNNYVILDTETTGLERPAEICQIAVISHTGNILVDTYVKPVRKIPQQATSIHGITDDMVKSAPMWKQIKDKVYEELVGKDVIVYNAKFDRNMLHLSDESNGLERTNYHEYMTWHCAMLWYAEYWGEMHSYYGTPVWQKLTNACKQQRIGIIDAHSALGDCRMTHALLLKIVSDNARRELARQRGELCTEPPEPFALVDENGHVIPDTFDREEYNQLVALLLQLENQYSQVYNQIGEIDKAETLDRLLYEIDLIKDKMSAIKGDKKQ